MRLALKSVARAPWLAVRRTIIIVCALAFVSVGFLHQFYHFDEMPSTVIVNVTVSDENDESGTPDKPSTIEHCLTCTLTAVPPGAPSWFAPIEKAASPLGVNSNRLVSYRASADTPPPKRLI